MQLSRQTINGITSKVNLPKAEVFNLPERVLQFGTGVFIRGLIDYLIDKANNAGVFNGRVVMVKSTDAGDVVNFREQDCLYTLLMKSVDEGVVVDERVICAAVSRVLDAKQEWGQVLACAANPELKIIVSNTTEAGIVLMAEDSIDGEPPVSFPGKLLAFLVNRYYTFGGTRESGMVIIPTELIPDNGTLLKQVVNELAHRRKLPLGFIEWLNSANDFCNSLVDRIVPGKLPAAEQREVEAALGYEDRCLIMAESFGLWAIQTSSARTRALLSFSRVHPGIHVVEDISRFRELKLRLLNGSHNLSCALGYLWGFQTVKEAMADAKFDAWISGLILEEIAGAIIGTAGITREDARAFGTSVLNRYRNPFIGFEWLSICVQDTSKIRIRAVPIVLQQHERSGKVGERTAMGFAAYILFMRSRRDQAGSYWGSSKGREYLIEDDQAGLMHEKWEAFSGAGDTAGDNGAQAAGLAGLVRGVLEDESLWGVDLYRLGGFAEQVETYLKSLL